METVYDYLIQLSHNPEFENECISFFNNNPKWFDRIASQVQGDCLKSVTSNIFQQLDNKFNDPERGVKLILDLGTPVSKYKQVSDLNKYLNPDTGIWEDLVINNVTFPHIFCSNNSVQAKYSELKKEANIESIKDVDFQGAQWCLDKWLEHMIESPLYGPLCNKTPLKPYEVIIRGNGVKVSGYASCFLLATLGNFGILNKCVLFNCVVNYGILVKKTLLELAQPLSMFILVLFYINNMLG